jgi:hypothetical protein
VRTWRDGLSEFSKEEVHRSGIVPVRRRPPFARRFDLV